MFLSLRPLASNPLLADANSLKPDLYLLTIAVGQYEHPDIPDLKYVADDARAMGVWAEGQTSRVYEHVIVDSLIH